MSVLEKDENGWLESPHDRIGKVVFMKLAMKIAESSDNQLLDNSLEFNQMVIADRLGGQCKVDSESRELTMATNPQITKKEVSERGDEIKRIALIAALSALKIGCERQVNNLFEAYLEKYYPDMNISVEDVDNFDPSKIYEQ